MICRIYDVVDIRTGEVLLKGSTIQSLSARSSDSPYNKPRHANSRLFLSREWEWPDTDKDFGLLLLRVREQFEVSRDCLWLDQGGRNIQEPAKMAVFGFGCDCESSRIGGMIAMRKMTLVQRLKGLRTLVHKHLGVHSPEWKASEKARTVRQKSGKIAAPRLRALSVTSQPLAVAASHAKKTPEGKSVHAVAMGGKNLKYTADERLAARRKSARDWATRNRRLLGVPLKSTISRPVPSNL